MIEVKVDTAALSKIISGRRIARRACCLIRRIGSGVRRTCRQPATVPPAAMPLRDGGRPLHQRTYPFTEYQPFPENWNGETIAPDM